MASKSSSSAVRDYSRLEATAFRRERARRLRTVVAGAGALGNEVIKNLALLGIGRLSVIDRDRVERSNLTRSVLFCTPEIESHLCRQTPKAELAAKRAREINPDVTVESFAGEIADLPLGRLRRSDLVFSCLDNELARVELSWACSRLDRPLVDGGLGLINSSTGLVSLMPGSIGPCCACRKGAERRREILQELQGREDPCWAGERREEEAGVVTTTPLMASMIGALQVEIGLRHCLENGSGQDARELSADEACAVRSKGRSYRLEIHPQAVLQVFDFDRSPNCPLHEPQSCIREVVQVAGRSWQESTPADLSSELGEPACHLSFDWPRVLRACCRECRTEWQPMIRHARFRKSLCPRCGSREVAGIETSRGFEADSPWANLTFAQLGFPAGNIYEIAIGVGPGARRVHVEFAKDLESIDN